MNYVYMRVLKHLSISKYLYFINRKQANRFTWMERPKNFNLTSSGCRTGLEVGNKDRLPK